jgi:hypothetical protein
MHGSPVTALMTRGDHHADRGAQGEFACMRCGKLVCQNHAYLIPLERRTDKHKDTHDLPALTR